ncbi:Transcriptional regulatory protein walR [Slackia heliotrinireducens]|uniref:Response regulator with CheY-like receiver domain and winged-helix DNA-binding domain n=1 Tax=Slackia heliotrinireducens (strain ATCC 29202 / DSM 20476 / NCTC 11029 / RHS 1) TaxID=471855 RepID=C7N5H9_SLAHD|nr:response regulator transcription factor [Slackia heliotrinireducens]ACV22164.1 response regulator with CheY-like receiver domain and winged-helix DNA-binding domain [Slackia heliotrinireducens DSM 20476]VEH00230.1 Transcriptional regulatory protein walR [Slackia heliotrinireducens]
MPKTILVVDDDASIRDAVAIYMKREGHDVVQAKNGVEALEVFNRQHLDLVILDVMMEGYNGFEVCSAIRDKDISLPIIILSAKDDLVDKGLGFKLGADDYITKPFEPAELVMRANSCLRNRSPQEAEAEPQAGGGGSVITLGDLSIDVDTRQVTVGNRRLDLTTKEYDILLLMARRPNVVFTRQQILDSVWGYGYVGSSGVVAVFIRKLREKIEADPSRPVHIITEWGVGYRIV